MIALLLTLLVVLSLLMSAQAGYTVYLMLYTWDHDQDYEAAGAPRAFRVPQISFTALLPAHHEEEVIGETLERVMRAHVARTAAGVSAWSADSASVASTPNAPTASPARSTASRTGATTAPPGYPATTPKTSVRTGSRANQALIAGQRTG